MVRAGGLGLGLVLVIGCGGDDGSADPWIPGLTGTSALTTGSTTSGSAGSTGLATDDSEGEGCEPGAVEPCLCPDGLSLGEQECSADGSGFGACACAADDDESSGSSGISMPPLPDEICYPGSSGAGTTCLPLVAFYDELPAGYEYPPGMRADGQDRPPLGLVDIQAESPELGLAPNFDLDELAQPVNGQWAVLQPHAIERLQAMRDQAGAIGVLAGYLSPAANMSMGGELYARHQYGDGFDLEPLSATLGELSALCTAEGGEVVEFETHLHCEFSAVPLDEGFFGPSRAAGPPGGEMELDAWLEPQGHGFWAPAVGFLEGEPRRQWTARDGRGRVLATAQGRGFDPPAGTVEVEVLVGGRVLRAIDVEPGEAG